MSGKMPSTYVGTAFIIAFVLITIMVLFLKQQWS